MIEYRERFAMEWNLDMIYGENKQVLEDKQAFPDDNTTRIACCKSLKTEDLNHTLNGTWSRYHLNHQTGKHELDNNKEPYTGVIVGVRADEEGSRLKERYFSPRDKNNDWDIAEQPPEFWIQYKTEFAPGTHIRVHPLLDWTELDIWEYIYRENIPVVSLYFDNGQGKRYRSLGCAPCTAPVESTAKDVSEIIHELRTGKFANIAGRSGRAQGKEGGGGLKELRRDGYM